jgi:hypothetical protein
MINIKMAASARMGRIKTSNATNPTFELSELGTAFTFGESIAYVILLGDRKSGTANRTWVEYFFGKIAPHIYYAYAKDRNTGYATFSTCFLRAILDLNPSSGHPVANLYVYCSNRA